MFLFWISWKGHCDIYFFFPGSGCYSRRTTVSWRSVWKSCYSSWKMSAATLTSTRNKLRNPPAVSRSRTSSFLFCSQFLFSFDISFFLFDRLLNANWTKLKRRWVARRLNVARPSATLKTPSSRRRASLANWRRSRAKCDADRALPPRPASWLPLSVPPNAVLFRLVARLSFFSFNMGNLHFLVFFQQEGITTSESMMIGDDSILDGDGDEATKQ